MLMREQLADEFEEVMAPLGERERQILRFDCPHTESTRCRRGSVGDCRSRESVWGKSKPVPLAKLRAVHGHAA